ncbi:hypothetical protein [Marinoscillum pacificum]|uniref:hypothetical protein n=1 Tax=Marinoscillum pacificum TaxID=392723 RepID=UPI002157DD7B|nr:hypothetical protein [Marinoscillum pacificum]
MENISYQDWGEVSEKYLEIQKTAFNKRLANESEAQTRFDVIDRIIREILQWNHGQISVEEFNKGEKAGFIDYKLISADYTLIIEAKKNGVSFPSPTKSKKLKLTGPVLGTGAITEALKQAEEYANDKKADIVIATNGSCWCFYPLNNQDRNEIYATILFPFDDAKDAELLFDFFACHNVENDSLLELTSEKPFAHENRILETVQDADARIDRNNIADLIAPALDNALYSETLLKDSEKLERCFVTTEGRTKFDSILNMHLADSKPITVQPAKRIKKSKDSGGIEEVIKQSKSYKSSPVTLVIGPVGAGKTTYLKHFELVKGKKLISKEKSHWVYIDFEEMGKEGNPRKFLYDKLNSYLLEEHPENPTDYNSVIEPAYETEINALARGPYAKIFTDKAKFNEKISELIHKDFTEREPYVNKVFKYIGSANLCVIVLDNVDLYEDDELETSVFSEAVAISKKIGCNILVSIRDTTFVKHRNDSIFNAFELKKLWLDPPPFKDVLSKRLSYSRHILTNKKAKLELPNSATLMIPDLGIFFDIVQSSILNPQNGKFLESLSDRNIRKGITLVRNFLTSGHIQADKGIKNYINGDASFKFPYHELFKGAMLGQWKHFKEERSEAINIYDARFGSRNLLLLRLFLLKYLHLKALDEKTVEVESMELIEKFSSQGASENAIIKALSELNKAGLINSKDSTKINSNSIVYITASGGYYVVFLSKRFVYLESILHDTAIFNSETWAELVELSQQIEQEHDIPKRLELRIERINIFLDYLLDIEKDNLSMLDNSGFLKHIESTTATVDEQMSRGLKNAQRRYN